MAQQGPADSAPASPAKGVCAQILRFNGKKQLSRHPGQRKRFAKDMERNLIWGFLKRGREVAIEHVKLDGRVLSLSEGKIIDASYKEKDWSLKGASLRGDIPMTAWLYPRKKGTMLLPK